MMATVVTEDVVTRDVFIEALINEILPRMNPYPEPKSVLVMDNVAIHDHLTVHELCKEYGVKPVFLTSVFI